MFRRITDNKYISKFLEIWSVPRYKALIKLSLYFIFFFVIIVGIRSSYNTDTIYEDDNSKIDVLEKYSLMDNYQYKTTIESGEKLIMTGSVNKNKQQFIYNNDSYYNDGVNLYKQEGDNYIKVSDSIISFDAWNLKPSLIYNLIKSGSLNYKTDFADGVSEKNYIVSVQKFYGVYYDNYIEDDDSINISVFESSDEIKKVVIDLTNAYYLDEENENNKYKVMIEYDFIGQVSPINIKLWSSE